MKVKNVAIAGAISLAAAAALSSPAYAATQDHHPNPPLPPAHSRHDGCTLSVSNPRPHDGQWETLTVQTDVGRSAVDVQIDYHTASHVWTFITSRDGMANRTFNVGSAAPYRRVTLVGQVVGAPRGYRTGATCYTSFTPR